MLPLRAWARGPRPGPSSLAVRLLSPTEHLPQRSSHSRAISRAAPAPGLLHAVPCRRSFSQSATRRARPPVDPHDALRNARPLFTSDGVRRTVRSPRTHTVVAVAIGAAVIFYFSNIQTVPVSGRSRFNCFSDEAVVAFSEQQVKQIEYEVQRQGGRFLPDWDPRTRMVKRVLSRLIPASGGGDPALGGGEQQPDHHGESGGRYGWDDGSPKNSEILSSDTWGGSSSNSSNSGGGGPKNVEWEVRVIDDPNTMNAFVLPGGKVFVHSGILRATRNEDGLAAVLGHEIAHNMASHVGERMSGAIGVNILLYSVYMLSFAIPGGMLLAGTIGNSLMNVLFSFPMSRMQESEADYIGLMLMAEACYDPREAVKFWQRMDAAARAEGQDVPELMSTHPSNEHRIEKVQGWLPEAMEKWNASSCHGTSTFADSFRRALERGVTML